MMAHYAIWWCCFISSIDFHSTRKTITEEIVSEWIRMKPENKEAGQYENNETKTEMQKMNQRDLG